MSTDKLLPQAVELEEAVIGALMLEVDAWDQVSEILRAEAFYAQKHGIIFNAIKRLKTRGNPVDILTVTEELKRSAELGGVGGAYYISQLTNRVASTANIDYHARIIVQKYIQRKVWENADRLKAMAAQETTDIFELTAQMQMMSGDIDEIIGSGTKISSLEQLVPGIHERYKERKVATQRGQTLGCPTGFIDLDEATDGWQESDMILLGARPSMGKTAMMLYLAKMAALSPDWAVLIFSVEMPKEKLADRIFQGEAKDINLKSFRHGRMSELEEDLAKGVGETISKYNIFIDDTSGIKPTQILSRTKKLQRIVGPQGKRLIVFVDYIGLMSGDGQHFNREDEVSKISRQLKSVCKRTTVPMIVLAQMNRQVESRGATKRPQLSDLRDSGSLEQDADLVMFLHRPEYYQIKEGPGGSSTKGVGEIIIAKHRNGPITKTDGEYAFFYNESLTQIADPKKVMAQSQNSIHTSINIDEVPF